jgi:hypothetical protein
MLRIIIKMDGIGWAFGAIQSPFATTILPKLIHSAIPIFGTANLLIINRGSGFKLKKGLNNDGNGWMDG